MQVSGNVTHVKPSATLAVAALAREMKAAGRQVVDLSAGQPDFDTPVFIAEAGRRAIDQGRTRYAPAAGLPELRAAIAADLAARFGVDAAASGVVVSAGAKQAIFNALFVLFGPGDRVLVPTPFWTSYPVLVGLARAEPVEVAGTETNGFKVGPEELEAAWNPSVRGLLLNSPSNPSGAVYSLEELTELGRWATERDVWIISDEIYGRIFFGAATERSVSAPTAAASMASASATGGTAAAAGAPRRPEATDSSGGGRALGARAAGMLDLPPELRERVVLVDGASKSFAMTGWRIGFSFSAAELASRMAALQSHITTCAATPCQVAAAAAYTDADARERAVAVMVAAFARRRDRVLELFQRHLPGVPFVPPEGAFYLFFRIDSFYGDGIGGSVELCRRILEEKEVALVPGAAFGDDRFARLSFAASDDEIEEGISRLGQFLVGS